MDYSNCTIVYVDKKQQAQVLKIVDGEITDPFKTLFYESISLLKKMQGMQESIDSGMLNEDELDICTEAMSIYLGRFKKCKELIDEGLQLRRDFMAVYNEDDNGWYDYFGCINIIADSCSEICRNVNIRDRKFRNWTDIASEYMKKSFYEEGHSFEDIFEQWQNRIGLINCRTLRTGFCVALKKCIGDMLNSARRKFFNGFITGEHTCTEDWCDVLQCCFNEAVKMCKESSESAVSCLSYDGSSLKISLERCSERPEHFHELLENTVEMQIRYDCSGRRFGFLNKRYLFTRDIRRIAEGCRQLAEEKSDSFDFNAGYGFIEDYYSIKIKRSGSGFIVKESIYDELSSERLDFVKEMSFKQFKRFASTFELWETAYPVRIPDII